jgi:hypothetical protein
MAQGVGNVAASSQLSGTGSITGFSSAQSSGLLIAAVFCSGVETSTSVYTMSGASLTWSFITAWIGGVGQSIFLFAAPFSATISSQTFTLTWHSPISSRCGFVLVELDGTQLTTDGSIYIYGSASGTNLGGQSLFTTTVSSSSPSGQKALVVTNPTGMISQKAIVVNPGGSTEEMLIIGSVSGYTINCTTSLIYTHNAGETVTEGTAITTSNASDIVLGIFASLAGGTDAIVAGSGYTLAITTSNFSANCGAAFGVVYQVLSAAGTQNPTATDSNGGTWESLTIAFEASGVAPSIPGFNLTVQGNMTFV